MIEYAPLPSGALTEHRVHPRNKLGDHSTQTRTTARERGSFRYRSSYSYLVLGAVAALAASILIASLLGGARTGTAQELESKLGQIRSRDQVQAQDNLGHGHHSAPSSHAQPSQVSAQSQLDTSSVGVTAPHDACFHASPPTSIASDNKHTAFGAWIAPWVHTALHSRPQAPCLLSLLSSRSKTPTELHSTPCPTARLYAYPLGPVVVVLLLLSVRRRVLHQSVTPLPGLGIQLSSATALSLLGCTLSTSTSRRFIPSAEIRSVVIHEALRRWNVVYYLGIVRDEDVVVAFEDVRPRLDVLVKVLHHVQEVIGDNKNQSTQDES